MIIIIIIIIIIITIITIIVVAVAVSIPPAIAERPRRCSKALEGINSTRMRIYFSQTVLLWRVY